MDREEARQYFKDKGLTYGALSRFTVDLLINHIQDEIMTLRKEDDSCILLSIQAHKYTAKQIKTSNYNNLGLRVDGTYFRGREAITFNAGGFIGFAGWASDGNVRPFIDGFIKWCDEVAALLQSASNG